MSSSFTNLFFWKQAYELVLELYRITNDFPKNELYGLTAQFRRAAFSIISNIAEGYSRTTTKEKIRFYEIARGSLEECKCCAMISHDLKYYDMTEKLKELNQLGILLHRYVKKIKDTPIDKSP